MTLLLRNFVLAARATARRVRYFCRFATQDISVHHSSFVSPRARLKCNGGGSITIGKNCEIHDLAMLMTYGGDVTIGDNCSVNPFTIIYGHGGVVIGDGVRIAAHCVVIPANHVVSDDDVPVYLSGVSQLGIEIADNVWIGAGARILDGVKIGRNAVVAAGGVVTKTVPDDTTVGGVPARALTIRSQ